MEWHAMVILGAYHGVNPGMGWLFAVALGMQQGSARGVWRALPPIALGHAAAVGVVLMGAILAGLVVPLSVLRVAIATILIAFGLYRLWRHRHPRFGGMRVGFRDLVLWSFLMASAHGAGFMVLPFVMEMPATAAASSEHAAHAAVDGDARPRMQAMAVGTHTLAYLVVTALIAWIVYSRLGLALLRTAWFNMDWLWAGALVVTGAVVFLSS
jgi:uncharacterized membrane protein